MVDKVWVPERWDVGLWDQAHWNGQLGFNAQLGTVQVNSVAAKLVLKRNLYATRSQIRVNGIPATLKFSHNVFAVTSQIHVNVTDAGLHYSLVMKPSQSTIHVDFSPAAVTFHTAYHLYTKTANVIVTSVWANLDPFKQPLDIDQNEMSLNFGTPRVTIPNRW